MAINPADFQHPDQPKNFREFFMLYFQDSKRLNEKLDKLDVSQQEDRDNFEAVMISLRDSISKQASCIDSMDLRLKVAEGTVKEAHDDIKAINAKTNWFAGINASLTVALGAILGFLKGS